MALKRTSRHLFICFETDSVRPIPAWHPKWDSDFSEVGETVFDLRRNFGICLANDQTLFSQIPQLSGEHFLGNTLLGAGQRGDQPDF